MVVAPSPAAGGREIAELCVSSVMPEVAVFPVSCVRGAGLGPLHACLASLACLLATPSAAHYNTLPHDVRVLTSLSYRVACCKCPTDERAVLQDTCEFQIDEIFHAGESSGPVVGGLLARGRIREGDDLLMGNVPRYTPCPILTPVRGV